MSFDSPDPHFERKLATIRDSEELRWFNHYLTEFRKADGTGVSADEMKAVLQRGALLRRSEGRAAA
jgi:hypothetical protein